MSRGLEASRLALFAREDARDAVRERQAHLLVGLFVLIGAGVAYAVGRSVTRTPDPSGTDVELASALFLPFVYLVPLTALGFGAPALVEKRTSGALTVLLGLPFSRRTVVLGTLLGRSVVLAASALAAMLVGLAVGLAMGAPVDPVTFVLAVLALAVLTATFTAIGVTISAATRTSTRATFAAFGAYVIFVFQLWGYLPLILLYVRHGFSFPDASPEWVSLLEALNPMTAFTNALAGVSPSLAEASFSPPPSDPAFYERPGFAAAVLVGWIALAIVVGLYRFGSTDL